jgi:hypothetical protein
MRFSRVNSILQREGSHGNTHNTGAVLLILGQFFVGLGVLFLGFAALWFVNETANRK